MPATSCHFYQQYLESLLWQNLIHLDRQGLLDLVIKKVNIIYQPAFISYLQACKACTFSLYSISVRAILGSMVAVAGCVGGEVA